MPKPYKKPEPLEDYDVDCLVPGHVFTAKGYKDAERRARWHLDQECTAELAYILHTSSRLIRGVVNRPRDSGSRK